MVCCAFLYFLGCNFPLLIMPGTKGCKNSLLKIGAIGMGEPDGGKVAFELASIISILDSKG